MMDRHTKRVFSVECDRLLTEGWPAGVDDALLLVQINASLGAHEIPFRTSTMVRRVRALGLYRPDWFISERARRARSVQLSDEGVGRRTERCPRTFTHPRDESWRDSTLNRRQVSPADMARWLPSIRDGAPSQARAEIADEISDWAKVRCDRTTVLTWGKRWAGNGKNLDVINDARKKHRLPVFEIA